MLTTPGTCPSELTVNAGEGARKPFVEPDISPPVDILEATVFFQVVVGTDDMPVDITD